MLALLSRLEDSADVQDRATYAVSERVVLHAEGRSRGGARLGPRRRFAISELLGGGTSRSRRQDRVRRWRSSRLFALGRYDEVEELLARIDSIPPGPRPRSLRAQSARFRARLAAERGEHEGVEQGFKTAAGIFREHGLTFPLAVTQLEHGEWLVAQGAATRRSRCSPRRARSSSGSARRPGSSGRAVARVEAEVGA